MAIKSKQKKYPKIAEMPHDEEMKFLPKAEAIRKIRAIQERHAAHQQLDNDFADKEKEAHLEKIGKLSKELLVKQDKFRDLEEKSKKTKSDTNNMERLSSEIVRIKASIVTLKQKVKKVS